MHQPREFFEKYLQKTKLHANYRDLMKQALQDPDVQEFLSKAQDQLQPSGVEKSASAIFEFYQAKTKQDPNLAVTQAGYEPFLRLHDGLIEVAYRLSSHGLQQQQQRKRRQRVTLVNLPRSLTQADFKNYHEESGRNQAFTAAIDLVTKLTQSHDAFVPGLYLSGAFGIGKTYLLGALANELAKSGLESTLVHFPTFVVQMKQAIQDRNVWGKLQELQQTPILMLDDIGADSLSPWVRDEILAVILQHRMQEKLTTCFTSNYGMDQLEEYLAETNQGIEIVKAKRIMERIRFLAKEYPMTGPNLRQD